MSESEPSAVNASQSLGFVGPLGSAGTSAAMLNLTRSLARVARFPTALLLTGETGTGKGTVARALHAASPRRDEPFIHVDCAGLVDGLLEAELYGVSRGAFTGATESRAGRFEAAGAGTLFLDEVGELSPGAQAKLLRALEEGTFERLGETKTRHLRARIVAATHVELENAVAQRRFRSDLFYRLRVLNLTIPPLREQGEDLWLWIERAARRASERLECDAPRFSASALRRMRAHDWPGNLRELFHLVEAATVLGDSNLVDGDLIDQLIGPTYEPVRASEKSRAQDCTAEREVARAKGNLSLAARRLGVPRSTLRYRLGLDDAISRGRRLRKARSIRDAPQRE